MTQSHEITRLIATVRGIKNNRSLLSRNTAQQFNVFDALGVEDLELSHSRFLAYLLNPRQQHDQGDKFLRSFLALAEISAPDLLDGAEVLTETSIQNGRLDIVIQIPSVITVIIENKVWAGDQEDQIGRYWRWLNTAPLGGPEKWIIYLTPTGRAPQDPILDSSQLKFLSYSELSDWLESTEVPNRLATVTRMYSETCRRIAGAYVKSDFSTELATVLGSAPDFAIALEIANFIEAERPRVVKKFWENVRDTLNAKLATSDFSQQWTAVLSANITENGCWLAMFSATPKAISEARVAGYAASYAITTECSGFDQWFGVWRPPINKSDELMRLDDEMSKGLNNLRFKSNTSWCGWRRLSDSGIVGRSRDLNEWLSKMNFDNQNVGTPLAIQIADGMWDLFQSLRERLDALNALSVKI